MDRISQIDEGGLDAIHTRVGRRHRARRGRTGRNWRGRGAKRSLTEGRGGAQAIGGATDEHLAGPDWLAKVYQTRRMTGGHRERVDRTTCRPVLVRVTERV